MTAGRGIVHSERTPPEARPAGGELFGIQSWVALPGDQEETAPDFVHYPAEALPEAVDQGVRLRLIAGSLFGLRSPVRTASEMVYADLELQAGARLAIGADAEERAIHIVSGEVELAGRSCAAGELLVLRPKTVPELRATTAARVMLLGGAPLGQRHVWWNFVSSSRERIEQAKDDWRAGRFAQVPEETEFIPLPEDPRPVRYP